MALEKLTLNDRGFLIDEKLNTVNAIAVGRPMIVAIGLRFCKQGNYHQRLDREIKEKCPYKNANAYVTIDDWREGFGAPDPAVHLFPVQFYIKH